MSEFPSITRGPRRTRFVERVGERASVVTAARHAARAAFTSERLQSSSPIRRNNNNHHHHHHHHGHQDSPASHPEIMPAPVFDKRCVLGALSLEDVTGRLLPWAMYAPITSDEENLEAARRGIGRGIYDAREVISLTNTGNSRLCARTRAALLETARPSEAGEMNPRRQSEEDTDEVGEEVPFEGADDDDDDELIDDIMDRDLGDEDLEADHDHAEQVEADEPAQPAFDPVALGLKEINNLAHFGVSSHKPQYGVEELLMDDLETKYWQSDGQQPHLLTIHFLRRVEIRAIRFYVDYQLDESYTPTNIICHAGTSHHDLVQFAEVPLHNPRGWQDVPIVDCGGGFDGNSLACWVVQMHIKENHQNGKDTHIRGIKIYALDDNATSGPMAEAIQEMDEVHTHQLPGGRAPGTMDPNDPELQNLLRMLDNTDSEHRHPTELGFTIFSDPLLDPHIR